MNALHNREVLCAGVHGMTLTTTVVWRDGSEHGSERVETQVRIKRRLSGNWYATATFPNVDWLSALEPVLIADEFPTLAECTDAVEWYGVTGGCEVEM